MSPVKSAIFIEVWAFETVGIAVSVRSGNDGGAFHTCCMVIRNSCEMGVELNYGCSRDKDNYQRLLRMLKYVLIKEDSDIKL